LFSGLSDNALEQKLSELLQERKMFYEKAALRWEVLRESTDAFAERLIKFNASDFG
jgi:shikimate kinase